MKKQTRDRFVLPILLPVGLLVVLVGVLYGFSRILLSLSANAATATALAVAVAIVVASAVVAGRRNVRASSLVGLVGAVTGVAMIAGGVAIATIGTEGEEGPAGEVTTVEIVAVNIAFEPTSITVPAGQPFQIAFDNQDASVQHNVEIFDNPEFAGEPVFKGELITGPASITYEVPALEAGTYAFRCVVHPNMVGTVEVVEGGEGGGGAGLTVVAQNIAFDTDTIELPDDTPATITFDNQDAGVQHNISIYTDDTLAEPLFQGELITGPSSVEYQIPPLPPGEYYFHCDVHPNMNGTVIVGGGAGGGASTGATGPTTTGPTATGPTATGPAETGPSDGGGEITTEVVAQGIAFDVTEIVLPAGQESTIHFVNNDAGVQHNIVIATSPDLTDQLFNGELITGPSEIDYTVPPLEAGTYYFLCLVHPNMNGTVTVR